MHLSERLRSATADAHRRAEDAPLVASIMSASISLTLYCKTMRNLFEIYRTLEQQLAQHAREHNIASVMNPRLERASAIRADLDDLCGAGWPDAFAVDAVTTQYQAHLAALGADRPAALIAHAYVRYLGDLSGGQMLARALAPLLAATAPQAVRFYQFGSKQDVMQLKAAFRDGLDALAVDQDEIVDEALAAFEFHRRLFDALWHAEPANCIARA